MKESLKRTVFFTILSLLALGSAAQEKTDTVFLFRFVPDEDMFYVPWGGNGEEFETLLAVVLENMEQLRNGERYINVTSYGASAGDTLTPSRMAYLRCHRVKSELIVRRNVTEEMFVTDFPVVTA